MRYGMPDEEQNGGGTPEESQDPEDRRERQSSDDRPEEGRVAGESPREGRSERGAPEADQRTETVRSDADGRRIESDRGDGERETTGTDAGGDTGIEPATASASGATKGADEAFCESCGEAVKKEAEICPHCGVSRRGSRSTGEVERNPGLAALASLILPGAGEVYNGEFALGGVVFLVYVVLWSVWSGLLLLITVLTLGVGAILWVFWPLGFLMNPVSAYISYTRAERINAGEIQV